MKVGIMSMQRIINYGSYMQALGLKITIESLGHEVEFVDYVVEPCINKPKAREPQKVTLKSRIKNKVKKMIGRKNLFDPFWEYCRSYQRDMLPRLGVTSEMKYHTAVDTLVIGSDEVFNCLQDNPDVGYSKELFGAGSNAKKLISYAASFGNTTMERLNAYGVAGEVKALLEKFDSISVRDENSGKVIREMLGKEPVFHLDPVLISDYTPYLKDVADIRDYIIIYSYNCRFNEEESAVIRAFAKKRGRKLLAISGVQSCCDEYRYCAPEEVLSYFKHADCIITDTFHGSIFSIINERPFVTIVRQSKGESYGNAEKLVDVLRRLHLENRILTSLEDLEELMDQKIDYQSVNEIRAAERVRSINYLKENL